MSYLAPTSRVAPTHVQIELTWRCNWRCVHCYQDRHDLEVLTTANLLGLFGELQAVGTMHVILTGGEPLVRKDLFILLDDLANRRILVTLYSNGHQIDKTMASRLVDRVGAVELSILAGDPQVHDALASVRGSHARTVRAARALRRAGIAVVLKTPVMREALGSLKAIELLALEIGAEWNADTEISQSYDGASYALQHAITAEETARFYQDYPQFNPFEGGGMDPGVIDGVCLAGRQYCFIDVRGNVYPCLNFKSASDHAEMNGRGNARMGNILTDSFREIWKSSTVTKAIRSASSASFSRCSNCSGGCKPCMALNFEETGELFRPAPTVCRKTAIGAGARQCSKDIPNTLDQPEAMGGL